MIQGEVVVAGPAFADAARWAGAWVPGKPDVPIRAGIRIEGYGGKLTLEAYDGESGCRAVVDSTGDDSWWAVVVSGRLLAALAPTLGKGDMTLRTGENGALRLTQGRAELTLPTMDVALWSSGQDAGTVPLAEIDGDALATVVKRVALASAESDKQELYLRCLGLAFDSSRLSVMAATREHFAAAATPWAFNDEILGPGGEHAVDFATPLAPMMVRAAEAFAGAGPVTLTCTRGRLTLATDTRSVTVPLIDCEGRWPTPAVQQLAVRPYDHTVTVSRSALAGPLKQAVIVREKDGGAKSDLEPISLTFAPGEILVGGKGAGTAAEATSPVEADGYAGAPVAYRFNPAYLADALAGSPGDTVTIEFMSRADHTGARFTCTDDPSWYHTVAPIRR
jgi:DNA polymerase III subunit beta